MSKINSRKKLDIRIKNLIENGIISNHRSMFVVVGEKARDQVPILFHIMTKCNVEADRNVLWAYTKELGFSSNRKKRMRRATKRIKSGIQEVDEDNPFEVFLSTTKIRYCYYKEVQNIVGQTYGTCVLQDFEAITPNILAQTVETVSGGGLVILLLSSMNSLKQLCAMGMDAQARFREGSHDDLVGRFNERLLLSLRDCSGCLVISDALEILRVSLLPNVTPLPRKHEGTKYTEEELELKTLVSTLMNQVETSIAGSLVGCCANLGQALVVLRMIDVVLDKFSHSTLTLKAKRGRGKSAALGLGIAAAVAYRYSRIFVTAPSPENLKTVFEYVQIGLTALKYEINKDFQMVTTLKPEHHGAFEKVIVFGESVQTVQYIKPQDYKMVENADIVCIDEAAAIPKMDIDKLFGRHLVFLSSTEDGYEGTGRSLTLNLIKNLREKASRHETGIDVKKIILKLMEKGVQRGKSDQARILYEISVEIPIRYGVKDPVEQWLNVILCLVNVEDSLNVSKTLPHPSSCKLYYISRDTLFSYNKDTERFLQKIVSMFVASHYKNSPNDIKTMSDAPAQHLFCLLGPTKSTDPTVLCVVQVALEGEIVKDAIKNEIKRGVRGNADMMSWIIDEHFPQTGFSKLSGARVVKIATHPGLQRKGYGSRTMELLQQYYEGKLMNPKATLVEDPAQATSSVTVIDPSTYLSGVTILPKANLPPLMMLLSRRKPEDIDYVGVSYDATYPLLRFFKKQGQIPVYLSREKNILTGDHNCIMIKALERVEEGKENENISEKVENQSPPWLSEYFKCFRHRFMHRTPGPQDDWKATMALAMISNKNVTISTRIVERIELLDEFCDSKMKIESIERYSQNIGNFSCVGDFLNQIACLILEKKVDVKLSVVELTILVGLGLQCKSVEQLSKEIDPGQSCPILSVLDRPIKSFVKSIKAILGTEECNNNTKPMKVKHSTIVEEKWKVKTKDKTKKTKNHKPMEVEDSTTVGEQEKVKSNMTSKKKSIDCIKNLIENGIISNHRSMFVIVGDKARHQIPTLYNMLESNEVQGKSNVLWMYKNELGFKRTKDAAGKKEFKATESKDVSFKTFLSAEKIVYRKYEEAQKVLGQTYKMCILQDFQAMTANILAQTVETVSGGGLVVVILQKMKSLKEFYDMEMDVHGRYKTELYHDIAGRFNERFMLSLGKCKSCLVINDELEILPISSNTASITPHPSKLRDEKTKAEDLKLKDLVSGLMKNNETQLAGSLVSLCATFDQGKAVLKMVEMIAGRANGSTFCMTASRGRGKSVALGLAIAAAVAYGRSYIYITAPSPENLKTVFEYVCKGLETFKYEEHKDYELIKSTDPEYRNAYVSVEVFKTHKQIVKYVHPEQHDMVLNADLICIDEVAAISTIYVRQMLDTRLVFLSSTNNGYEGTGRSLSLKLITNLREKASKHETDVDVEDTIGKLKDSKKKDFGASECRSLCEIDLQAPIKYGEKDSVEQWLNSLLCLNIGGELPPTEYPYPGFCELYYVNKDTLFSGQEKTEKFLQKLISIYVASHYKNSPNDLQMIADAPAHHLFCLLGMQSTVLCIIQVAFEGCISKEKADQALRNGSRGDGNLIPWVLESEYKGKGFAQMSGIRIVRIATHPAMQGMGYGTRAMEMLKQYFECRLIDASVDMEGATTTTTTSNLNTNLLEEEIRPRTDCPPLMVKLTKRRPENIDYIGVSYGATCSLVKFWEKQGLIPVYFSRNKNAITGEHNCIMLKMLNKSDGDDGGDDDDNELNNKTTSWLSEIYGNFRSTFLLKLHYILKFINVPLALAVLMNKNVAPAVKPFGKENVPCFFSPMDLVQLDSYSTNLGDHLKIDHLLRRMAFLVFKGRLNVGLNSLKLSVLLGIGVQGKSHGTLAQELKLDEKAGSDDHIQAILNQSIRAFYKSLKDILDESKIETNNNGDDDDEDKERMKLQIANFDEDLADADNVGKGEQRMAAEKFDIKNIRQYAIKTKDWSEPIEKPKFVTKRKRKADNQQSKKRKKF